MALPNEWDLIPRKLNRSKPLENTTFCRIVYAKGKTSIGMLQSDALLYVPLAFLCLEQRAV